MLTEHLFKDLLNSFIKQSYNKTRRKVNGLPLQTKSVRNYEYLLRSIAEFEEHTGKQVLIYNIRKANAREIERVKRYWSKFYKNFSDFLYGYQKHNDNYVGQVMKLLKAFVTWVNTEKGIDTGLFYKKFYRPKDEIPIMVLNPDQLKYLIFDQEFEDSLWHHTQTN